MQHANLVSFSRRKSKLSGKWKQSILHSFIFPPLSERQLMYGGMKKRKRIDGHELQSLRNIVKDVGADILKKFDDKFKEIRVEGCQKDVFFRHVHRGCKRRTS